MHCYQNSCAQLVSAFHAAAGRGQQLRLVKSTSNLFRRRTASRRRGLDVRSFRHVLEIDSVDGGAAGIANVEGMATYELLTAECLKRGFLPAVVPQLKTITVGGAVSGVGIESSSFRFGLVHETVVEMDVLVGDGSIVTCSANQNADLFHGIPNSYGTLGYILRLNIKLIQAQPYVHLVHNRFGDAGTYFDRIAQLCSRRGCDYVDGAVFDPSEMYLATGEFTKYAPHTSDYTYMDIYYKSIQQKAEDWLTAHDYIWRWDTDWFWCSNQFHLQNPLLRFLATPMCLNSGVYQRLMRLSQFLMPPSSGTETVIQDVDLPIGRAAEFLEFLFKRIGIRPVWVCPFVASNVSYPLYELLQDSFYINFGFWDAVRSTHAPGYYNRLVEDKVRELGGMKSLYSSVYYSPETFDELYNGARYRQLKQTYDPHGVFPDLYWKVALENKAQPSAQCARRLHQQ